MCIRDSSSSLKNQAKDIIQKVDNELQKLKPDHKALLRWAFDFPQKLCDDTGKKAVVILDNFENILELNNFSQVRDVLSVVSLKHIDVRLIASSSFSNEIEPLVRKHFETVRIVPLDRKAVDELCSRKKVKTARGTADQILRFTAGHQFVTEHLVNSLKETGSVKRAFAALIANRESPVYTHLAAVFHESIGRARGQALLKTALNVLSSSGPLSLTELSRKIYRSAPVTKSLLERLIYVDLIVKKDGKFTFSDPALGLWLRLASSAPLGKATQHDIDVMEGQL